VTGGIAREELEQLLGSVKSKRARIVIEHVFSRGSITTEELERDYGYRHPPRAARDVRDVGIPLETFKTRAADGRTIAGYRLGDLSELALGRIRGRISLAKVDREKLLETAGCECAVCATAFEKQFLQVDHCVPFAITCIDQQQDAHEVEYMVLCRSCNRAKSWCCENCGNMAPGGSVAVCQQCYWASPGSHTHVALEPIRRLDLAWRGDEVGAYDLLVLRAERAGLALPAYVKTVLRKLLKEK
jgi:hypothetical protein